MKKRHRTGIFKVEGVEPFIRASIYAQCNIPVLLAFGIKIPVPEFSHYFRTGITVIPYVNPVTGPF
jgi:hypothetical protein